MIDICYSFHALYSMHSWPFFELLFWVFAQVAPSLSGIEGFFMACFCPQPFRAKWIDCSIYQTKNWENKDTEAGMYIVGTIYLLLLRSHVDLPIKLFYKLLFHFYCHQSYVLVADGKNETKLPNSVFIVVQMILFPYS